MQFPMGEVMASVPNVIPDVLTEADISIVGAVTISWSGYTYVHV